MTERGTQRGACGYVRPMRRRPLSAMYGQLAKMSQTLRPSRSTCEQVLTGADMDTSVVGPLRLWQRNEGESSAGVAHVVRGLEVVHDRAWDTTWQCYVRSSD